VGQFEGIFYFIMEFVDGATLSEILRQRTKIDPLRTAEIAYQVCQALRHAHRKNIIHRDIKPENIMITSDGVVKLADLGLAKRMSEGELGLTQTGAVMGTPYYMAPEQAKDFSKVDSRSDIYSLGVTIYRALTGRVPFEGKSPLEVMIKACNGARIPMRQIRPEIPEDFEALVDRMMHPNPDERFQDVQEVIDRLGKLIHQLSAARQA
jgi:serine/threonine-protein kinase